jgi:hypothetical protein
MAERLVVVRQREHCERAIPEVVGHTDNRGHYVRRRKCSLDAEPFLTELREYQCERTVPPFQTRRLCSPAAWFAPTVETPSDNQVTTSRVRSGGSSATSETTPGSMRVTSRSAFLPL